MTIAIDTTFKRIATYERVSSDDQKLLETIKNQTESIARSLQLTPGVRFIGRYADDGVSGTIPFAKRLGGRQLLEDAAKSQFDEVWVWKIDRLGRDDVDPLVVWRELERFNVKVHSVTEGVSDIFSYHIYVAMAAEERRKFLERSAAGIERAVKEGRFPGGICPLGYEIQGRKHEAKIFPSNRIIWNDWTAADLIRHIYELLGKEHWSCPRIAEHLNALGVPTAYQHLEPGPRRAERGTGLQAKWRAGRICNMVKMTVYKGVYQYGKRSKKNREVFNVQVPKLVSDELWQAAQETLARNRIIAKNTPRHYLLSGLMKCGLCGKSYCVSHGRGHILWWRCNGRMINRYTENRCLSKGIKGSDIETVIWNDIERWLRNPGDLIKELQTENDRSKDKEIMYIEKTTLETRLISLGEERKGYYRQNAQGLLNDLDLREFLKVLADSKAIIEKRLSELNAEDNKVEEKLPDDLLQELRYRLDNGLNEEQRQEIAQLLVKKITVRTENCTEKRQTIADVEYRFSEPINSDSGRGSLPPPA